MTVDESTTNQRGEKHSAIGRVHFGNRRVWSIMDESTTKEGWTDITLGQVHYRGVELTVDESTAKQRGERYYTELLG
ncbi:hypothetical protein BaRGS_00028155 [Batillaria attramentaria]|uniref:Uncharacterized protein n=1 Tax=Batillaria attramentaria TaxID=370345 RepID=A0ABD0K0F1_9CAEN